MLRRAAVLAVLSCYVTATPAVASPRQAPAGAPELRLAAASSPAAPPAARSAPQTPLSLSMTSISNRTIGPRSKLELSGTVVNRSIQPLAAVYYRLRYNPQHMVSRGRLAQVAQGDVTALPRFTEARPLGNLPASTTPVNWKISVPARSLGFSIFGSYAIGVEFYTQAGQPLAGQVTFAVWQPDGKKWFKETSIGWIWPLTDRMHRSGDRSFLDDRLETDLSPTGRLGGLVGAAQATRTPLTWAIDPALLDDAQTMAAPQGYVVRSPGREQTKKPSSTTAKDWLNRLRGASDHDPYFALPYADVDADALVRQRLSAHLKVAYEHMNAATSVMGRPPTDKVAWPLNGVAEAKTLGRMAELGSESFLMSSAVFQPGVNHTPSSPASMQTSAGTRSVVTYDATLSKIVSADTRDPADRLLVEQRFLAETAMITAEYPEIARTIVVAPSRRWNPDPAFAQNLLNWTDSASWLSPAHVDRIADTRPRETMTFTGYPSSYEAYELGRKYLAEVNKIAYRAARFSTILRPAGQPYERSVLRLESGTWRGSMARRARDTRDDLGRQIDGDISKVGLLRKGREVRLGGRTGKVPLTFSNELGNQDVHLRLEITSQVPARLQIGEYETDIKLSAGERLQINVELESYAQGPALMYVRLLSLDGKPFRREETLTVNATGYGSMALLITGGSLAVLFVGVGFRAIRARRRNKLEATGDGSPGGEPSWTQEPRAPFPP
ncbi:hypothetical protein DFJ69_2721 [Thermomonospora umbrina]|uniref:Secreted protein n=1 Tax=Thermomonospora umbrina TaxID=111806 RepID=A0A3D9SMU8_9ACTN|nr:hypothetical protein DFJ69_2721 [Thermomonospora umbrina]